MQIIALIPAYEPGETLLTLLGELRGSVDAAVVVDDGSGKKYAPVFERAKSLAHVVSYADNRGKGRALKIGFSYIESHFPRDSVVVTLDADGQHKVGDVLRVAQSAEEHPGALTLGSRGFGDGTPARSSFGNAATRTVFRLSTGVRVGDTQTGLRAFGARLLPVFTAVKGERYEYEMNALIYCTERGIEIREVPIETVYVDGNSGSHFRTLRDSLLVYGRFLKFAASSLAGFAVDYGLYSLIVTLLTPGLGAAAAAPCANVSARAVSACVNYALNRRFVFNSSESVLKTGAQYFALAACILAGNTLLLSFLVGALGADEYAAKLLTELTFCAVSFAGQRFLVFKKTPVHEE